MNDSEQAPPRLVASSGVAADLVRRALSEQALPAPLPRFTQLQERRASRGRRQAALVGLAAAAAAALIFGVRSWQLQEPPVALQAEPASQFATAPPPLPSSEPTDAPPVVEPHAPNKPPARREAASKPRASSSLEPRSPQEEPAAEPVMPTPAELSGGAKPCAELARSGAAEQAIGCYDKLSSGQGVTAELALFEQSRLAGKVLRQPARALAVLNTYRERFPNGSLRAEVMLARIEWLLGAGDQAGARVAVEEALKSGLLQEREAELQRLRDSLEPTAPAAP